MMRLSAKLLQGSNGWWHFCPGCRAMHRLPQGWDFDGNVDLPSFKPSFHHCVPRRDGTEDVCHYNITSGNLEYFPDTTHEHASRMLALPPIPLGILERWFAPLPEESANPLK